MIVISLLTTCTFGHMYMTSPQPTFLDAFQNDKASPSVICDLVQYSAGSPTEVIPAFNAGLQSQQFKNLRAYVDACNLKKGTKSCGNTVPNALVPFPADNTVKITIGADHIGPSEIWVDDNLVMSNPGIDGTTVKKTPPSSPVDFAKACPSGNCQVRFVMAALHNSPAEIYDNCVRITASGGSTSTTPDTGTVLSNKGANNPVPDPVVVTTYSKPTDTPTSGSADQGQTLQEWSCGDENTLVRNVNGNAYSFACPTGTTCKTTGLPYAMCT